MGDTIVATPELAPEVDPGKPVEGAIVTPKGVKAPGGDVIPAPAPGANLLAGKFVDQDALLAGYLELEKKQSAAAPVAPATPAATDTTPPGTIPVPVTLPAGDKAIADAAKEHRENAGVLSDKTYASLEKAGHGNREAVDERLAGRQAMADKFTANVAADVGGMEAMGAIMKWAGDSLSPEEIADFNTMVSAGNIGQAKLAMGGLAARYAVATGDPTPTLVTDVPATPVGGTGFKPYASQAEITADMNSPAYSTDPAFRQLVENRIAVGMRK